MKENGSKYIPNVTYMKDFLKKVRDILPKDDGRKIELTHLGTAISDASNDLSWREILAELENENIDMRVSIYEVISYLFKKSIYRLGNDDDSVLKLLTELFGDNVETKINNESKVLLDQLMSCVISDKLSKIFFEVLEIKYGKNISDIPVLPYLKRCYEIDDAQVEHYFPDGMK